MHFHLLSFDFRLQIARLIQLVLMATAPGGATAGDFPARPVRIVTQEAGGGTDFTARLLAPGLTRALGFQVIVENSSDIWRTHDTPATIAAAAPEPTLGPRRQMPTENGTVIRIGTIPPESEKVRNLDPAAAKEFYARTMGNAAASRHKDGGRHPLMHRTQTIDYAIVLAGEITMVMDDSEVTLRAGDVLVQRGTNHAWSNRSDQPCKIAFILIDGKYDDELAELLKSRG